jgi:hypothetical protein
VTDKTPTERFKRRGEYTVEEELAVIQAERRGDPSPRFETDEYRQARRDHLEAGGFETGDDEGRTPLEDMTPEDHFNRMRRTR